VAVAIKESAPDFVFHLAAQPLVRLSYAEPRKTYETNAIGTLSVLEAMAATPSVKGGIVVTTDKVYKNVGQAHGYVETDALGGHDPYSASKAMADILTSSWISSFGGPRTAIARAGNVIGGGDVSADRLFPDLMRSFSAGTPAQLRNPLAVRPWQHVLDCLHGYVMLAESIMATLDQGADAGAWNFGPDSEAFRTVGEAADLAAAAWGPGASWEVDSSSHPHEAHMLTLDATKAKTELGWHNRLSFEDSFRWTVDWHKRVEAGESALNVTLAQIEAFEALA
jgi:CDP-glucose 4,6-dehydratase